MLTHANGECGDEHTMEQPLSLIPVNLDPAMGGEHNDRCTPVDREEGCDCWLIGFSSVPCDGCGTPLSGDRYRFTLFERSA
jgi:hypothetical protein